MKYFVLLFAFIFSAYGQVVTTEPAFPRASDSLTVYFHADQGNQALMNFSGTVYAHAGLITENSTSPTNWLYVISAWGENLPKNTLTRVSTNLYRLDIGFIEDYYVDHSNGSVIDIDTEEVLQLAFVFRNSSGTIVGREADGSDIYAPIYKAGITAVLTQPALDLSFGDADRSPLFLDAGDDLEVEATAAVIETEIEQLELWLGETNLFTASAAVLSYSVTSEEMSVGHNYFSVVASDTNGISDTLRFTAIIDPEVTDMARPDGTIDGISYPSPTSVTLSLLAPDKEFVYLIGDFNDWKVQEEYLLKKDVVDAERTYWWITLEGLTPGDEYGFQYLVDGEIRVTDPYSEKILDAGHDPEIIADGTYPNLKIYPYGKTEHAVGVLNSDDANSYEFVEFERPDKEKLIVYELLIRDFLEDHSYESLIDTLDYLENLGINAIELMPHMEFDGNDSWGYNPAHFFAVDKYYGTEQAFVNFVNACHERGIAVLVDMVLNHATGQNPLVRLYNEGDYGDPTSDNPWFNVAPTHDFNVFNDFNHESEHTQYFVDRVNRFWLEKYNVDGYRFDLTKGFMQTGSFYNYNASRIALLKRMADEIWEYDSDAYVILEHLGPNNEETELANYGMMLWGKMTDNYNEATMGYHEDGKSDLSWAYFGNRGWNDAHLVTYMESHDEERLMFKNLTYGNSSGNYSVQELQTATERNKMAAAFFFTLPGPKMLWQFGEVGYDVSIDDPCRTCRKPIRWEYFQDEDRNKLYRAFAAIIKLRNQYNIFNDPETQVVMDTDGAFKWIKLENGEDKVAISGNFGVTQSANGYGVQEDGWWYDFFSGDSLNLTTGSGKLFDPGEFHILTNFRTEAPDADIIVSVEEGQVPGLPARYKLHANYPNPFNPTTTIRFDLVQSEQVEISVFNALGQRVDVLLNSVKPAGSHTLVYDASNLASGVYFVKMKTAGFTASNKMLLLK
jgi:1,4-alpha-glucan branching enzyme